MPFTLVNENKVYYEVHGDSEHVLVILNGIMMSSASWIPFVPFLSKHFKVVLVDFFDQGKSDYLMHDYDQDIQIELVESLIITLKLKEVTLLGISYGGEVAMKIAARKPSYLSKLILANTTAYTNEQLKAVGDSWIGAAKTYDGKLFFKATIPPIYSSNFYESKIKWLSAREKLFVKLFDKHWYDGFIRLVISAENHDERENIKNIEVPTLVIGAENDYITPISCQRALVNEIVNSSFIEIKDCGHASMYEKPIEFFSAVIGFHISGGETFKI